jgi:hypothetical protein
MKMLSSRYELEVAAQELQGRRFCDITHPGHAVTSITTCGDEETSGTVLASVWLYLATIISRLSMEIS